MTTCKENGFETICPYAVEHPTSLENVITGIAISWKYCLFLFINPVFYRLVILDTMQLWILGLIFKLEPMDVTYVCIDSKSKIGSE